MLLFEILLEVMQDIFDWAMIFLGGNVRMGSLQCTVYCRTIGRARTHGLRETKKIIEQEGLRATTGDIEEVIEVGHTELVAFESWREELLHCSLR
ncbi:hypothetical protein D3C87_1764430 [compost metagenome]